MKSKIRYLISALVIALIAMNCSAQDTLFLNGTNKVTKNLSKSVSYYFINCKLWPTASTSTIRTISGVGKVTFTATGSVSFTPTSSNYVGVWTYHLSDCNLTQKTLVVMTKPFVITQPKNTYTLTSKCFTSAGVYQNGKLVRTLWNNIEKNAGTYTLTWDNKSDLGTPITGTYHIKVISNNVTSNWSANYCNTSSYSTGEKKLRGLRGIQDAVEFNGYLYYCTGLVEGEVSTRKTLLTDLKSQTYVFPPVQRGFDFAVTSCTADSSKIFWAGIDPYGRYSGVFATDINDNEVIFTNGSPLTTKYGRTYNSVLDARLEDEVKGMAISGNYLFVSHANDISILNRKTGALVGNIIGQFADICTDAGFLYAISSTNINKYSISNNGSLSIQNTSSSNGAVAISVSNGIITTSKGQEDINDLTRKAFLYQGANGIWESEAGCNRIIRKLNGVINAQIAYLSMPYNISVDRNNPTRLFVGFAEYEINLSTKAWTLKKYWGDLFGPAYKSPYYATDQRITNVVTVNNRTLALVVRYSSNGARGFDLFELNTSPVLLKTFPDWDNIILAQNGDIVRLIGNNFEREVYNGSTWAATKVVATLPNDSLGNDLRFTENYEVIKTANKAGFHVGKVNNGWEYLTAPSVYTSLTDTFPANGSYDIAPPVQSSGYGIYSCDSFMCWNYVGEFWHNAGGQVNKWNFYLNGLMIHQYGVTAWDVPWGTTAWAKMEGNVFGSQFVKYGGKYYIVHGGESFHSALHAVELDFSSIKTQIVAQ